MLGSHLNAIEKVLIAQGEVASNAGHPNLKGGPREWFIRQFLENHLPSSLMVGQGEVFDVNSVPKQPKGQLDTVVYRRDVPLISYARTDSAFLIEGVMAVIEIKSDLTKKEAKKFAKRTKILKEIHRPQPLSGFYHGFYPLDRIASYLVAYNGPKKMETVVNWLNEFNYDIDINRRQRIDMIIVLGKGVVCRLASLPRPLQPDQSLKLGHKWLFVTQEMNNLYALFSHMLLWVGNVSVPSNLSSYLDRIHTEAWKSS